MSNAAIIFRTHFWDAFVQRQFDRLLARVQDAHVYVLVDETRHAVPGIPHDRVVRMTEGEVLAMGFPAAGEGSLLWFNGDYPLYRFLQLHPAYDYYLQLEYDVVINADIDALIHSAMEASIDMIALTKGEAIADWPWTGTCTDAYDPAELRHQLICVSGFSNRALRFLWERRLVLGEAYRSGVLRAWPMCEGFVATEMARAGMRVAELSEFGSTDAYDHWPPYLEDDVGTLAQHAFVHPVLDQPRFVASLFKYQIGLGGYVNPNSLFHRKLRRLPASLYLRVLVTSFAEKAMRTVRQMIGGRLGEQR